MLTQAFGVPYYNYTCLNGNCTTAGGSTFAWRTPPGGGKHIRGAGGRDDFFGW